MVKDKVTVTDKIGFHARTASLFAKKAVSFESAIQISFNDKTANGKSILSVMTLGIKSNSTVEISADGADESEALKALTELIKNNFNS